MCIRRVVVVIKCAEIFFAEGLPFPIVMTR